MNESISIAAIGAGAWGRNLVRTLDQLGVLRVVAESAVGLRSPLQETYPHLEMVEDAHSLLDRSDIQAVTIATPAPTHHALARAFLLAGKDVFVEKPMTLTSAEAADLVQIAEENQRILMVGHLLLYKPAIAFIRDFLAAGRLGRVFTLHQERAKHGKARAVENALWSLGVHDVAALLHLAGATPSSVSASGHAGLRPEMEDDVYLHLGFEDGRMAHLHSSWLWPEDRRRLTVIGALGMLVYDEKAESVTLFHKSIDADLMNVDLGSEIVFQGDHAFQPLAAELTDFIECVQTRRTPRSDGRQAVAVVQVLEQAFPFSHS
jgi:predicted dehydrogenase